MIASRRAPRDSLLFVYGTLRPCIAIPKSEWLSRVARYVGRAKTKGRLYDLGRYPGLRAGRTHRDAVLGDVYRVPRAAVLRDLDRYEAGRNLKRPLFVREAASVVLSRRRCAAWLYVYDRPVKSRSRISHGDYGEFVSSRGRREGSVGD